MSADFCTAVAASVVGGLLTSPFFVYLGFRLNESSVQKREHKERAERTARAAASETLLFLFMTAIIQFIPATPDDIQGQPLHISMEDLAFGLTWDKIIGKLLDLPEEIRTEISEALKKVSGLIGAFNRVADRASEPVHTGDISSPFPRAWESHDSGDSAFVQLYATVTWARTELLAELPPLTRKLAALAKPVLGNVKIPR